MQADRIEPMEFHGPGWTLDLSKRDEDGEVVERGEYYWLWAPQTPADVVGCTANGRPRVPRAHWAASWQSGDGEAGDFIKGATASDVIYIFPDRIARRFREVV